MKDVDELAEMKCVEVFGEFQDNRFDKAGFQGGIHVVDNLNNSFLKCMKVWGNFWNKNEWIDCGGIHFFSVEVIAEKIDGEGKIACFNVFFDCISIATVTDSDQIIKLCTFFTDIFDVEVGHSEHFLACHFFFDVMSGQGRGLGLSLLKNLGLKEDEVVEETFELKVRPKGVGICREIDELNESGPLLKAVGAWRLNGPKVVGLSACPVPGTGPFFCQGKMFPKFQAAICRFHEKVQKVPESQIESLNSRLSQLNHSMHILEARKASIERLSSARETVRVLTEKVLADPHSYDSMFDCVLELARNQELLAPRDDSDRKYQKYDTDSLSVPHIAMVVATSYSQTLMLPSVFNLSHIDKWISLRDWLFTVHAARVGNMNTAPDKLWVKFLKRTVFVQVQQTLSMETAPACVNWVNCWVTNELLSTSTLEFFFLDLAKPFLVDNLQALCLNFQVNQWIELANETNLSSQFAIIVRLHAEKVLRNWSPPSSTAFELISQWPHTLGTSGDFLYKVIAPKLAMRLSSGDIQSFLPFLDILPDSLAASLIADSYLTHVISEITRLVSVDLRKAACVYADARRKIPEKLVHTQKVKARLIDALDKLKEKNPMLRGLKVEREIPQTSIVHLLESIAKEANSVFIPQGTVDGRAAYLIGGHLFSVMDGVLYRQDKSGWIPILIRDLRNVIF